MYQWSGNITAVAWFVIALPGSVFAAEQATKISQKIESYSVGLGATRVIYDPAGNGAVVSVNNPNDFPVLVQSKVFGEDTKTAGPFVVTPPVFRLDGHQQSRIRVVRVGGDFPADREMLQWLCVTGIPPETDDAWAQDKEGKPDVAGEAMLDIKVRFSRCIKLLVRPSALKGGLESAGKALSWQREGEQITIGNASPFYINLKTLSVGGKEITPPDYIPPFGSRKVALPKGGAGRVQWTLITDLGGEGRPSTAVLR
ncbi:TPA: fimbria/pilus periplasmic chaperone [Serratia marcescens]|nr:fimbria/pilus periplasmic chaperone [Serratia marcescens]